METWAALFDWDGVIIDSSRPHEESWDRLAAEEKRPLPRDHFQRSFGMKNEKIIPEILGWTTDPGEIQRLSLRKEELYRAIIFAQGIEPLPGVQPWLEMLQTAGVPCVIASSTHRENITSTLDTLGFTGYFRDIVAAEDVNQGKPDPAVFLLAAGKVHVPPGRCVVFEDAPVGIEAAHRAGMKVVGVATTHAADTLTDADRIVHRLDELRVTELRRWFRSRR